MKRFEWDESKRQANLIKHGIDFIDAIEVFNDIGRIEAENIRNNERRIQTIGIVNKVVLLVAFTYRGTKRRIISARRASKDEREIYFCT